MALKFLEIITRKQRLIKLLLENRFSSLNLKIKVPFYVVVNIMTSHLILIDTLICELMWEMNKSNYKKESHLVKVRSIEITVSENL